VLFVAESAIRKYEVRNNSLYLFLVNRILVIPFFVKDGKLLLLEKNKKTFALPSISYAFDFLNDEEVIVASNTIISLNSSKPNKLEAYKNFNLPFRVTKLVYHPQALIYKSESEVGVYDIKAAHRKKLPIDAPNFLKKIDTDIAIIGSSTNGVYIYNFKTRKLTRVFKNVLSINNINPYKGNFLVSANEGLFLVKIENDKMTILRSFLTDPFLGIMVNGVIVQKDLFVLTNQGIIILSFSEKEVSQRKHDTFFFELYDIQGKKIKNNQLLDLNSNAVSGTLQDGSFFNYSSKIFRYKLLGYDKDWTLAKNGNFNYRELPSGEYQFIVQTSDSEFGEFENQKTIRFSIDFAFYRKWWFYGCVALFCVLLGSTIYFYLKSNRERKNSLKAKMRELEFRALKAQLNPHFVFNALNSIQSMAFKEDKILLNDYICTFSDLIRNVLDASKQHKVSLTEEMNFLRNYLLIEKMRMDNSLEFEINYHASINPDSIFMYGMIIQPIVENCIVHGFRTNQDQKRINIDIEVIEDSLRISVTDNGIGRSKSEELNRGKTHKSWASTILQEKSDLLNSIHRNELTIETLDLTNEKNEPTGTKVIVLMKINE